MLQVIKKDDYRIPVKSWCPDIEASAMAQVDNLARLPFAFKQIVLCPDAHAGYGNDYVSANYSIYASEVDVPHSRICVRKEG